MKVTRHEALRVESGYKHQRITLLDEDDLRAITNCKVITGELLVDNSELTNLDGLENLKSILGGLRITGNRNLTNVAGLRSLRLVDFLEIENNPSLATLAGLERVETRETIRNSRGNLVDAGWVVLNDNRALEDLEGLPSLDRVFSLEIKGNSALQNLHGLEGISSIFDGLFIIDNASLTDIRALKTGCQELDCLHIRNNPKLPNCQAEALGGPDAYGCCTENDEDAVCE